MNKKLLTLVLVIILFAIMAMVIYVAATSQETMEKASRYDFYESYIIEIESCNVKPYIICSEVRW